jgi:acyl-CoA reductase-like NAD-dependent aldehyde dehydrogenase
MIKRAPVARKKVLLRFAELIRKHRDELALSETMDMGKPISDSRNRLDERLKLVLLWRRFGRFFIGMRTYVGHIRG